MFRSERARESGRHASGELVRGERDGHHADVTPHRTPIPGGVADEGRDQCQPDERGPEPGADAREPRDHEHDERRHQRPERGEQPRVELWHQLRDRLHVECEEDQPERADRLRREGDATSPQQPGARNEDHRHHGDDRRAHAVSHIGVEQREHDRGDGEQAGAGHGQHGLHAHLRLRGIRSLRGDSLRGLRVCGRGLGGGCCGSGCLGSFRGRRRGRRRRSARGRECRDQPIPLEHRLGGPPRRVQHGGTRGTAQDGAALGADRRAVELRVAPRTVRGGEQVPCGEVAPSGGHPRSLFTGRPETRELVEPKH